MVITCDNNSEPVKQRGIEHLWKGIRLLPLLPRGIEHLWKGIRLLPLLPSYVSLVVAPRLSR